MQSMPQATTYGQNSSHITQILEVKKFKHPFLFCNDMTDQL